MKLRIFKKLLGFIGVFCFIFIFFSTFNIENTNIKLDNTQSYSIQVVYAEETDSEAVQCISQDPTSKEGLEDIMKLLQNRLIPLSKALVFLIIIFNLLIGKVMSNEWLAGPEIITNLNALWIVIRNIVNIGFLLILLYVAIITVIGMGEKQGNYQLKSLLPKFIIAVILVNFSFFLSKSILDIGNIVGTFAFSFPATLTQEGSTLDYRSLVCFESEKDTKEFCLEPFNDEGKCEKECNIDDAAAALLMNNSIILFGNYAEEVKKSCDWYKSDPENSDDGKCIVAPTENGYEPCSVKDINKGIGNVTSDNAGNQKLNEDTLKGKSYVPFDEATLKTTNFLMLREYKENGSDDSGGIGSSVDIRKMFSGSGIIMAYSYGIFRVPELFRNVSSDDVGGNIIQVIITIIFIVMIFLVTLALAVAFSVRLIMIWIFIALSPLIALDFAMGGDLKKKIGNKFDADILKQYLSLVFMPAFVGVVLSFGLIILGVASKMKVGDSLSTFSFLGQTINFVGLPIGSFGGDINRFILSIFALVIMWVGVFAALNSNKITEKATSSIQKIGTNAVDIGKNLAKTVPILPTGSGMVGLGGLERISDNLKNASARMVDQQADDKMPDWLKDVFGMQTEITKANREAIEAHKRSIRDAQGDEAKQQAARQEMINDSRTGIKSGLQSENASKWADHLLSTGVFDKDQKAKEYLEYVKKNNHDIHVKQDIKTHMNDTYGIKDAGKSGGERGRQEPLKLGPKTIQPDVIARIRTDLQGVTTDDQFEQQLGNIAMALGFQNAKDMGENAQFTSNPAKLAEFIDTFAPEGVRDILKRRGWNKNQGNFVGAENLGIDI